MPDKRLLVVEEALRNREGHWFEYNRATKSAVQSGGDVAVDMLGHRTMEADVAEELGATPHFRYTVWDQIYNHPQAWRRYFGIGQHNYRLYRDLSAYLKQVDFYDTVFAPTVVLHHLLGYHAVAKRFAGKRFGQLVLLIRNNIALYDSEGRRTFRSTARFWKAAIRRFQPLLNEGRARFVTDSERLADEFEALTGIRFEVLPHPSLVGLGVSEHTCQEVPGDDSRPVRIFLPGPARHEKGVVRLLDAAKLLSSKPLGRPIEIALQWREAFDLPDGKSIGPEDVAAYESNDVKFHIIKEPLSSKEYLKQLNNADLIILPYLCEVYYARISGVAVEAMMLGKPLLYTSNTWVATICHRFNVGISMSDDATGVAEAIAGAIGRLSTVETEARLRQSAVSEFFSPGTFSQRLLQTDATAHSQELHS